MRHLRNSRGALRRQRRVTELETAIILIAFLVVASVFAFTVLSTGIFSAERGKETIHAGLMGARSSLELKGSVVAEGVTNKVLSLGVINGRNIWRADLDALLDTLTPLKAQLGERLWLAPSCSLLHSPVDLDQEDRLDDELKSWLSFAKQKLDELAVLGGALDGDDSVQPALQAQRRAVAARGQSKRRTPSRKTLLRLF